MKFLVLGATGTVGSQVVHELVARKQQVRVVSRNPDKAKTLGSSIDVVQGDVLDPGTVRTMYDGVDGVFVLNPVSQTETCEGLMAISAAKTARVPRLVYMSVQHVDRAPYLPHFGSKIGVETAVRAFEAPWTIVRPSNFHQNDNLFRDAILQYGVYPQPLGTVGVSRVDVRDIAELAAMALTEKGHEGKTYDLIGPRPVTGPECATIWAKALGRPIAYGGDDLEAWEKQFLQYMPAWMVYDFKLMFHHFQTQGLKGTEAEVATLTKALGHPPRSFEAFVAETSKAWLEQGAPAR